MRLKVSILIPLSVVLGLAAVQSGRGWLDRQVNKRVQSMQAKTQTKQVVFDTIVVASQPLRFGMNVKPDQLKEIPWPSGDLPQGAFKKVRDIFKEDGRRVVLAAIEANEPLLTTKITGPGQKANLAGIIEAGMKAITVRVDDVVGVAGFVLPGDRVDVLLTRKMENQTAFSDNILQNIKVLAIDQKADERLDKPSVARAVTLEVTTEQAQRLIVAQKVGTLTMVLRPVGEAKIERGQRISSNQLSAPAETRAATPAADIRKVEPVQVEPSTVTVNVIRKSDRQQYNVPMYRR
ncbi:MAG: Flp pilus assembly protein CpaB [Hyphomicrobiales bacterium]|nr:Flp pilus assembly protein CpaB [Hyphomicrobiales bacterium]